MSDSNTETMPNTTPEEVRTVISGAIAKLPADRVVAIRAGDLRKIGVNVDKAFPDLRPVTIYVAALRATLAKK